jgi:hypothetical protein
VSPLGVSISYSVLGVLGEKRGLLSSTGRPKVKDTTNTVLSWKRFSSPTRPDVPVKTPFSRAMAW